MGILLSPCINYRAFFHTGGSYCTICALWSEAGCGAGKFALWCLGDLFSDLMPVVLVREGGELQHDRARQGLVPDLKLLLNIPGGQDNCLALDWAVPARELSEYDCCIALLTRLGNFIWLNWPGHWPGHLWWIWLNKWYVSAVAVVEAGQLLFNARIRQGRISIKWIPYLFCLFCRFWKPSCLSRDTMTSLPRF